MISPVQSHYHEGSQSVIALMAGLFCNSHVDSFN